MLILSNLSFQMMARQKAKKVVSFTLPITFIHRSKKPKQSFFMVVLVKFTSGLS